MENKQIDWIQGIRKEIDEIDNQIINLIGQRFKIIKQIGEYKKSNNVPMMQNDRVTRVIERCCQMGEEYKLNKDMIKKIYNIIIEEACDIETKIIESN